MSDTEVRFEANSLDELRDTATRARAGDRARVTFKGRKILMRAVEDGPLGLVWEEIRE